MPHLLEDLFQVPDDYFVLPRIETATRMVEDGPAEYEPPQPAVSTRVPGQRAPKVADLAVDGTVGGDGHAAPSHQTPGEKQRGENAGVSGPSVPMSASHGGIGSRMGVAAEDGAGSVPPAAASEPPRTGSRTGELSQARQAPSARRGPLPTAARAGRAREAEANAKAALRHGAPPAGATERVGKAGESTGGTLGEEMAVHEGHNLSPRAKAEETAEERLARIRSSNMRRNFRAGNEDEALFEGLSRGEQESLANVNRVRPPPPPSY